MKSIFGILVTLSIGIFFWKTTHAQSAGPKTGVQSPAQAAPQPPKSAPPASGPLLLDDQPLLLLDEIPTNAAFAGQIADNSRCFVCHMNYSMEQLAVTHARTNIGCVKCHGACDAHIADESWASGGNGTPPDILILKANINRSCFECHEPRKLSHKDHLDFLWGVALQQFCTDCHGKHRLPQRKCKWK